MTKPQPVARGKANCAVTQDELFRLICAYAAIYDRTTRFNILMTMEEWVVDQLATSDAL